ncbi:MAG: helix-hairpin-helix domain-containing protein [Candidatus Omnitrophota bacterium]
MNLTRDENTAVVFLSVILLVTAVIRVSGDKFDPRRLPYISIDYGDSIPSELNAPVDVNTADENRLITLEGIGPVTAARIVDFRERYGPFVREEDVMKVKGIGRVRFEKIKGKICVRGVHEGDNGS